MRVFLTLSFVFFAISAVAGFAILFKGRAMFKQAVLRLSAEIDLALRQRQANPQHAELIEQSTTQASAILKLAIERQRRFRTLEALNLTSQAWDVIEPCYVNLAGKERLMAYRPRPVDTAQRDALEALVMIKKLTAIGFLIMMVPAAILHFF